ncbi:hypothetical protein [Nostoc sp. FACHB-888]|uniref:hypothetical protein n=1 Tax=Nostoc sp. FACHB-888 TaxID=2692842 RepID=UPI001688E63C|nr:hypothetical protein [Nostoc sp. FACHB-888]MBD2247734.1 hypothetical protein [Nostoc sp. FACHB-888]
MAAKAKKAKKSKTPKQNLVGVRRMRGEPIMYDEVKGNWNLKITPTAKKLISDAAKLQNCSPSEFIERWARAELINNNPPQKKTDELSASEIR